MSTKELSQNLLAWYDVHGRALPWRHKGGAHPSPYAVLVSEIMLQQTTVKTVMPYFERFMRRFPTVYDLAAATQEEIYQYWQGLGYYSRARSLHAAAQTIVNDFGGCFPNTRTDVLKLKGVGAYTASSFLALAFNRPETVVDGNVMRIICRMYHLTAPLFEIKNEIAARAAALTSADRPADYASAIMDLGAVVCTPRKPHCDVCPWRHGCLSAGCKDVESIPNRIKTAKKKINGYLYLIKDSSDRIFIRCRTEKGLLSGLWEFPWSKQKLTLSATDTGQQVTHIFTHIKLTLHIFHLRDNNPPFSGKFIAWQDFKNYPTSSLMKKVYKNFSNFTQDPE